MACPMSSDAFQAVDQENESPSGNLWPHLTLELKPRLDSAVATAAPAAAPEMALYSNMEYTRKGGAAISGIKVVCTTVRWG